MKTLQVKVNQFGQNWDVFIDGKQKTFKQLTTLCNVPSSLLRSNLNKRDRERRLYEWILKARAGVKPSCKTHWYGSTPMWIPYVMKKAGITNATASYRILAWRKMGDTERLMRPQATKQKPKPKQPATVKPKKKQVVKPKPKPVIKPPRRREITDEFDLSRLSGRNKDGHEKLQAVKGPSEYELKNL